MSEYEWLAVISVGVGVYIAFGVNYVRKEIAALRGELARVSYGVERLNDPHRSMSLDERIAADMKDRSP